MPGSRRFQAVLTEKLADSLSDSIPAGTDRTVRGPIGLPSKATAVIGMRRSGKTTFLHQVRRERLDAHHERARLPYFNFEDERLAGLRSAALGDVVEEYYRQFPRFRRAETVTWCLDEIQVVPGWERFVRRLLDSEKVEVLLSGSSATLLSREIATAMRGRAWALVIHPFSFGEYLRHHREPVPDRLDLLSAADRSRLEGALRSYLIVGGFPEAQGLETDTRHRLLADYVDVAIFRDVVERHGVTNVAGLRWMVRHLLGAPAALFSAEKFYGALRSQGIAVAKDTVHDLLAHLEDCFLIRTSWIETASERRRRVNPRKAYPVDPGLIPVFDRTGRRNLGHALETAVRIELERRGQDLTYVRTKDGHEVDFLARGTDGRTRLIQVCAALDDSETCAREVRGLIEAAVEHPKASLELVTLTPESADDIPRPIVVRSAATWLLGDG